MHIWDIWDIWDICKYCIYEIYVIYVNIAYMRYRIHMLQHGSFNNNIYFIHFINKMAMKYVKTLFREKKITFNTYFVNYKDYRSERDWWRILKWTCIQKWVCPIYNGTLKTFDKSSRVENSVCLSLQRCLNCRQIRVYASLLCKLNSTDVKYTYEFLQHGFKKFEFKHTFSATSRK